MGNPLSGSLTDDLWPGRADGFEDALERDQCALSDLADSRLSRFEQAQDDLVGAHEQRAQIADLLIRLGEVGHDRLDSVVEQLQICVPNAGPEALG